MGNEMTQEQKDQLEAEKLCPAWRKALLDAHAVMMQVAAFVERPKNWVFAQLNGTAEWQAMEANLDKRNDIL